MEPPLSQASIYERIEQRMNLIDFCRSDEFTQEEIIVSCIRKRRFENLQTVVRVLKIEFDKNKIVLAYYKCCYCEGYHFTSKRKRTHKRKIYDMLMEHKKKLGEPIPKLDPDKFFRRSSKSKNRKGI